MSKKGPNILINVGTSSLLVIFVILCLVTFATLSLVSANADYKLSQELEYQTTHYYSASNTAETILNDIDNHLLTIYSSSISEADYFNKCQEQLNQSVDGITYNPATKSITYRREISSNQVLSVALNVLYPDAVNNRFYEIATWQEINTDTWHPDTSLNLLQIN